MSKTDSKLAIAVPVVIIVLGVGWLLTVHGIVPGVNWVWTLGLAAAGVLTLVAGIDKVTIAVGPFLIIATFFSILRQRGLISVDTEVPCMVIVAGVLLLLARLLPIRSPTWLKEPPRKAQDP